MAKSVFTNTGQVSRPLLARYLRYLRLERAFSDNTLRAYVMDLQKLLNYFSDNGLDYRTVTLDDLTRFVQIMVELGIHPRSVSRVLSGVRAFYRFLVLEKELEVDPTELLCSPKRGEHLPDVLSLDEVERMERLIDLSRPEGQRDKAMLETLYSCGLRVSELCGFLLSNYNPQDGYIRIHGKGNKERLIPIGRRAIEEIDRWLIDRRRMEDRIVEGQEDFMFLSFRRGVHGVSRSLVFRIVKDLADRAGIHKTISPHTFRHSFATSLLDGGANLRAIQDMLGHENLSTTEIYVHIDDPRLREEILVHHPRNNPSLKQE